MGISYYPFRNSPFTDSFRITTNMKGKWNKSYGSWSIKFEKKKDAKFYVISSDWNEWTKQKYYGLVDMFSCNG